MSISNQKKIRKAVLLSVIFGIISSIITYLRLEPDESFIKKWLPFYIIGLLIVAPIAIILFKKINNLIYKYSNIKNMHIKGVLFGLLFSTSLGFLLSTLLALLSNNYTSFPDFFITWKSIIYSFIPRILIIGPIIGGVIKPLVLNLRNKRLIQKKQDNDISF
ncbi:hypothetical protein [Lacinutrix undariae]